MLTSSIHFFATTRQSRRMSNGQESEQQLQHVTEDEAALYDRQIRLWGLEAQTRIRKAHILIVNLEGLTTECIKNLVLAGIASLTIVDFREKCQESDLSAGFFWREEDVGSERLGPAAARMQVLNPLVSIKVLPTSSFDSVLDPSSSVLKDLHVDTVVVNIPSGPASVSPRWSKESLVAISAHCRALEIPFYTAGTTGFNGWIFADLGAQHDYVKELDNPVAVKAETNGDRSASAEADKPATGPVTKRYEKRTQDFVELGTAVGMTWKGATRAETRKARLSPGLFGVWALWELAVNGDGQRGPSADELQKAALTIMEDKGVDATMPFQLHNTAPKEFFDSLALSVSVPGEFAPTCAILGGVLAQNILNALGGREEPIANWFQLDGLSCLGLIHSLGTKPSVLTPA